MKALLAYEKEGRECITLSVFLAALLWSLLGIIINVGGMKALQDLGYVIFGYVIIVNNKQNKETAEYV